MRAAGTYHGPTTLVDEVQISNERRGNRVGGTTPGRLQCSCCYQRAERGRLGTPHRTNRHEKGREKQHRSAPHPVGQGHPPNVGCTEEEDMDL